MIIPKSLFNIQIRIEMPLVIETIARSTSPRKRNNDDSWRIRKNNTAAADSFPAFRGKVGARKKRREKSVNRNRVPSN